jgi:NAD-dependent deacetylase
MPPHQTTAVVIADWLAGAASAVAFTGAGISTESGIPDFRSPGGVWAKYEPVYYEDFLASAAARHEYWRQKCEAHEQFAAAGPNAGHRVLSEWERNGRLRGVITQNIDGLHQLAGSRTVLELHGTAREVSCLDCDARFEVEPLVRHFHQTNQVPPCPRCAGRLKLATISFGQPLPEEVLSRAGELARACELFLAIGSSLVVHPAASLPALAKRSGARLVIINRDETPLDDLADMVVRAPIGETLLSIQRAIRSPDSGG